jgi:hypothetical protein
MPEEEPPPRIARRDPRPVEPVYAGPRRPAAFDLPTLGLPCERLALLMAPERLREILCPREIDERGRPEREDDLPTDRDGLERDTREADERFGRFPACACSAGTASAQAKTVPQNQMLRLTDDLITHPLIDPMIVIGKNDTYCNSLHTLNNNPAGRNGQVFPGFPVTEKGDLQHSCIYDTPAILRRSSLTGDPIRSRAVKGLTKLSRWQSTCRAMRRDEHTGTPLEEEPLASVWTDWGWRKAGITAVSTLPIRCARLQAARPHATADI